MKTKVIQKNTHAEWQTTSFGEVATLRKGLTYKSSDYSDKDNGMVFLTLKSILRGGGFNTDGIKYYLGKYENTAVLRQGDLIIANTDITRNAEVVGAPVFVPLLSDKPVLMSMDLSAIDVNEERVNKLFFYYLLQDKRARDFMRNQASGSTVLHLKTSNVPKFKFQLPTLIEQKKIADILSTVDKELQKIDEVITATEKLKSGLTQQLFDLKGKNSKLKDVTILITKGTTPTTYGHPFTDEGVNFFKIENIDESGNINLSSCRHISNTTHEFLKRSQLMSGDVLFSIAGALGRITVINQSHLPANVNQALAIIRLKNKDDAKFVSQVLRTDYVMRQVIGNSVQLAQANISLGKLGDVKIPWPEASERERISNIIQTVDEKVDVSKKIKNQLLLLKKGLMQDLLSGKKRTI